MTLIKLDFDLFLGMTSATLECWGGYYCPGANTEPNPAAYVCPTGMACPNGSSTYQVGLILVK